MAKKEPFKILVDLGLGSELLSEQEVHSSKLYGACKLHSICRPNLAQLTNQLLIEIRSEFGLDSLLLDDNFLFLL